VTERVATAEDRHRIRLAVARLRAGILAVVFGLIAGSGLAFATAWLTLLGGDVVGPHLGLLRIYFPGYTVTWTGSLVGFLYGFATGAAIGGLTAWIYNRVLDWRWRRNGDPRSPI
jgi:hypothetical protein